MARKRSVGKKPATQSIDWRAVFTPKVIALVSVSFILLVVTAVLFFVNGNTRYENDLPVNSVVGGPSKQTQMTNVQQTSNDNNSVLPETEKVIADQMGDVGVMIVRWMDFIVMIIILGFIVTVFVRLASSFK